MKKIFGLAVLSHPSIKFPEHFIWVGRVRFDGNVAAQLSFRAIHIPGSRVTYPEIKMHKWQSRVYARRVLKFGEGSFRFLAIEIGFAQHQMKFRTISSNLDEAS